MSSSETAALAGQTWIGVAPGGPPLLYGDHPAMHLLNSRAMPGGREAEWIGNGADFVRWLRDVGFDGVEVGGADPAVFDTVAAEARRLREWWRGFVAAHAGAPLTPAALAQLGPLVALLRQDSLHRAVAWAAGRPGWRLERRHSGPQSLLQPLAGAVGDLLCEADFSRVRHCEGPGCTIWFLDRTKSGKRRWCSMAACGNRAKASAHRARARAVAEDAGQAAKD